ncbi:hypothetical protein Calag_1229 [Caldisphaera lagunensis DSM 15908]|uniref:Uncharacterized protein n=1 Tax=Caldisphaera lagunensis (strain DSM 15908 / JCM 11604 / ANMR 0165 / IC-154) TaxID=1056495 RepID=L0AAN4_CALLD|nr:hypothetical protein [Caldisphaera lagunensis]AFZ70946.1 hypothetical protein Calag_1229 [Caldisphaera lagunensis DSM 15908]
MEKELRIMMIILVSLGIMTGLILGITGIPMIDGLTVTIGFILYIVFGLIYPKSRFIFLGVMVGGDVGAIITLFSHPLVLPFVIIERGRGHSSIDIDFVQIIVFIEVIYYIITKKIKR